MLGFSMTPVIIAQSFQFKVFQAHTHVVETAPLHIYHCDCFHAMWIPEVVELC